MPKIGRFIIGICSKHTKTEIEQVITGPVDVLKDRNPDGKPKDDFKEKHPNYWRFAVSSLAPLTEPPNTMEPSGENNKEFLAKYEQTHGKF